MADFRSFLYQWDAFIELEVGLTYSFVKTMKAYKPVKNWHPATPSAMKPPAKASVEIEFWREGMLVIVWFIAFIISLVALILAAASGQGALHMAIAAIVALLFAIIAVREDRRLRSENASEQLVAASNARHMGFVWAWGAAGLFLTYTFILSWHEWLTFFIAFVIAAALCLFFSNILRRDAEAGKNDETISSLARYLTIGQLVGMIVTMVGLWLDGKMERFLNARQGWEDWAANNFFFFGAMALVIISANALYTSSRNSSTAEAKNNSNT